MGGNQINLFKKRWEDGSTSNVHVGNSCWGGYAGWVQGGWYGETLTRKLTGYWYRNRYLFEVYHGR